MVYLTTSCDRNRYFEQNIEIQNEKWAFEDAQEFSFELSDTVSLFNFYINLRNTNEYPFASTQKWRTHGTVFLPVSWQWSDIITRYWEEVIKWRKRRLPIEFENIVSPTFIANLNFRKKFAFQNTLIMLK